jgi:hypothetical protein
VQQVDVEPVSVNVAHEHLAAKFLGPGIAQVDHEAAVGVTAAGLVAAIVAAVRRGAQVVAMIGDGHNVGVGVWIEMRAGLALKPAILNDVKRMRNDAGLDESLAMLVEVYAPGVAGPSAKTSKTCLVG